MKKEEKYKKYLIVFTILILLLIAADLFLFWTSMQQTGIGRGFSRFWI